MFKKAKAATLLTMLFATGSTFAVDQQVQGGSATLSQDAKPATQVNIPLVSKAFGHFIGKNLNTPGVNFDLEAVIQGMRDGAAGRPAPMSDKEYEQMMVAIQENAFKALSENNAKAAAEYLSKNRNEQGVVELENGKVQYKIEQPGTGEAVSANSSPQINYTGKFIDGTVFNSSEQAGGPVTIPLDQTIKGFSIGIVGMKEGEKRRLFIHPDLGYGTTGHFPPNSLLIFDVEVIKAKSPDQSFNEEGDDEFSGFSLADADDDEDDDEDDDDEGKSVKKPSQPIKK